MPHEAYSLASYDKITPAWQKFCRTHHTSSKIITGRDLDIF
jgi:hypothetical protein